MKNWIKRFPVCQTWTSQVKRHDIHTVNKKTQGKSQVDNLPQSDTSDHTIVHTKQDLMNLFANYFTGLGIFQGDPYLIEVDPSVHPGKHPVDLFPPTNIWSSSSNWWRCKLQTSSRQYTMPHHGSTVFWLLIIHNWKAWQAQAAHMFGSFQL